MNFVQLQKSLAFLPLVAFLSGFYPGTIISEPRITTDTKSTPPLTILYSGITKLDTNNALLLKIDSNNPDDIISTCSDERIVIDQRDNASTLQWKPGKNCTVPLITYKGKNYILPLNQKDISLDVLSDISSETLRNTLSITTLINTDTKLSSLKTRKIIRNISTVLEARSTPFVLPIE